MLSKNLVGLVWLISASFVRSFGNLGGLEVESFETTSSLQLIRTSRFEIIDTSTDSKRTGEVYSKEGNVNALNSIESMFQPTETLRLNRRRRAAQVALKARNQQCQTTKTVLLDLKLAIQSALFNVTNSQSKICTMDESGAHKDCHKLFSFMQCALWQLNMGSITAYTRKVSLQKFQDIDKSIKMLAMETEKIWHGMSESSQGSDNQAYTLRNLIQLLSDASNKTMEETISRTHNSIQMCVLDLGFGGSELCADFFLSLNDDSLIRDIVTQAYLLTRKGRGSRPAQVIRLLDVMKHLPDCNHIKMAGEALLEVIRENNDLLSVHALDVSISKHLCINNLGDLKAQVNHVSVSIARDWALKVRTGIRLPARWSEYPPDKYLEEIILTAYDNNMDNIEKCFRFVRSLGRSEQVLSYPVLFNAMRKVNGFNGREMLVLAERAYQREHDTGRFLPGNETQRLVDIRLSLPNGMHALLLSKYIEIKSKSDISKCIGVSNGNIVRCPCNNLNLEKNWAVAKLNDGEKFKFQVVVSPTSDLVNVGKSLASSEAGRVIANGSGYRESQWDVIPVNNGESFYFKNHGNGRILSADSHSCGSLITVAQYDHRNSKLHWKISELGSHSHQS